MTVNGNEPISAANVAAALRVSTTTDGTAGKPISAENLRSVIKDNGAAIAAWYALENLTWQQIVDMSALANAMGKAKALETFGFYKGQTKTITYGGIKNPLICVAVCPDKQAEDGSMPLFMFRPLYSMGSASPNGANNDWSHAVGWGEADGYNGWRDCKARSDYNGSIYNSLPSDLKAIIKPVINQCLDSIGGTTVDKLWAPISDEIAGPVDELSGGDYFFGINNIAMRYSSNDKHVNGCDWMLRNGTNYTRPYSYYYVNSKSSFLVSSNNNVSISKAAIPFFCV